jgi:ABC-type transport system involved in multi-copper enzyme maturation permease subunit
MGPLLKAELLKLRTTRTFLALVAAAVGLSLLLAVLVAALAEPTRESVIDDVFASDLSSLFILVLGVIGVAGEWRHRTITSSLLAAPDRLRFLLAKAVAYAAAGAALSLLILLVVAIAGFVILSARDLPTPDLSDLLDFWWRSLLISALLGAFGVGVGALVRNQPIAIVAILALAFVIEPALLGLAPDVGRFGPVVGAPTAIAETDVGIDDADLLAPAMGVLVSLAWVALTVGLGAALLRSRDLD